MRKCNFIYGIAITVVSLSSLATSCKKTASTGNEDVGYASEQAVTEKTFNDVQTIADQASTVSNGAGLNYRTSGITGSGCATVSSIPGTITINFGSSDCLCKDGRTRRGEIIVTYTGKYAASGSVHTITFR
jgi:hypothetical protein